MTGPCSVSHSTEPPPTYTKMAKVQLSGVTVNTLLVRTWQHALPDAILPINQPTTVGNDAAEIAAIYPLYQTGNITAQGAATLTTLPQVIVTTASTTAIQPPSLDLAAGDIAVGARVAVV